MLDNLAHEELRNPSTAVDEDPNFDASLQEFMSEGGDPKDFEDV